MKGIKWFKRDKVKTRQTANSTVCPVCKFGTPLIYDTEHDACPTCNHKWKVDS